MAVGVDWRNFVLVMSRQRSLPFTAQIFVWRNISFLLNAFPEGEGEEAGEGEEEARLLRGD